MQGDPKVIEYLNKGLRHELTAINQYWLHYRLMANWGLSDMAIVELRDFEFPHRLGQKLTPASRPNRFTRSPRRHGQE